MKINCMEIIISFQQSVHVPPQGFNKFILGTDQQQKKYPFLTSLTRHLMYSPEQGLKIQISDFFKQLFDGNASQILIIDKEIMYQQVLGKFLEFFKSLQEEDLYDFTDNFDRKIKNLEYSAYLMLQILNKVVEEHRYPFRGFMNKQNVIACVAQLSTLNSKMIDVEIVKFYSSLLKSKDHIYIHTITYKNLFYPINTIFMKTYHPKNPPMIQSCIRDLYRTILGGAFNKSKKEFFSQKLAEYLCTDEDCRSIIFNEKYKDVFCKYQYLEAYIGDASNSPNSFNDQGNGNPKQKPTFSI